MYKSEYEKALKYSKESPTIFDEKEGHEIHDNASPEIYEDWLEDRGLEHIPKFIREASNNDNDISSVRNVEGRNIYHVITSPQSEEKQRMLLTKKPHMFVFRSGGYDKVPSTMAIKLMVPSSHSGMFHNYYSNDLPHEEGKELYKNLSSEGVIPSQLP